MLQVDARQDTATTLTAQAAARTGPAPGDQQPLRFLLLRQINGRCAMVQAGAPPREKS
jgi:hypothetical protein